MKKITYASIVATALLVAVPAFAAQSPKAKPNPKANSKIATSTQIENSKNKADQEIDRRVQSLTNLMTKSSDMKKVSEQGKASISDEVQKEITNLQNLKAKIASDTSTTTLKEDVKSITQAYRIYALIVPQGHILVAADRINTIANSLSLIAGKLQTRIAELQASGKNVTALQTALTDMNEKIADALLQAQTASTSVSSLVPDNGDNTVLQANKKALADANTKIKAGNKDLTAARKDVDTITKVLKTSKPKPVTASTTPEAGTTTPTGNGGTLSQ